MKMRTSQWLAALTAALGLWGAPAAQAIPTITIERVSSADPIEGRDRTFGFRLNLSEGASTATDHMKVWFEVKEVNSCGRNGVPSPWLDSSNNFVSVINGETTRESVITIENDEEAVSTDGSGNPIHCRIEVTLVTGTGYTVGSPVSQRWTIIDDESLMPAVSVTATSTSESVNGNPGVAVWDLKLEQLPPSDWPHWPLSVNIDVERSIACADGGADHTTPELCRRHAAIPEGALGAHTVRFSNGQRTAQYRVALRDDENPSKTEGAKLRVLDGEHYRVHSNSEAMLEVSDSDTATVKWIGFLGEHELGCGANYYRNEGDRETQVRPKLTVDTQVHYGFSVSVGVIGGTADKGGPGDNDFSGQSLANVQFEAHQTRASFEIEIHDDTKVETTEWLLLQMVRNSLDPHILTPGCAAWGNPMTATSEARVYIEDNDHVEFNTRWSTTVAKHHGADERRDGTPGGL